MKTLTEEASLNVVKNMFNAVAGGLIIFAAATVLRGFAISTLWNWFVASPLNAQTISIGEGLGLSTLFAFLTVAMTRDPSLKGYGSSFAASLLVLAWACILHYGFGIG